jgi:FkbM family methyltransferase
MRNYAFGKTEGTYRFRNGGKLKIHSGFDHVPIIEVMMKKDYGKIRNNITIIDIGASTGVFSVYACSTAKNLSIYAFEPSLDYFSTLKENIRINNLQSSVKCFNNAVAGANEVRNITLRSETFIYPSLKGESENANSQSIECVTLAKIMKDNGIEKVGLLKMDCEGAEYEIFKNTAADVLEKVEEIRMEYHNIGSNENVRELRNLLLEKGFEETHFSETTNVFGNIWFKRI